MGTERLETLLAGQLLRVDGEQLLTVAMVYVPGLFAWYFGGAGSIRFYLFFAVTVTLSVQLVGVYLVFSGHIVPALPGVAALAAGYGLGIAAFAGGLLFSLWFDTPAGPTVVWILVALGVVLALAGRRFTVTAGAEMS